MPPAANSSALLYGKGVFTTIAVVDEEPFLWEKHWRRLMRDSERLGISTSDLQEAQVLEMFYAQVSESAITNGRARVTIYDDSPSMIWGGNGNAGCDFSVLASKRRQFHETLRLGLSPFRINSTSPLAGVKSCNYLEPLLAFLQAQREGRDEALRLNERGEVAGCCMSNIFWLAGEKLFTPALSSGCLPGTTREHILESLEVFEVSAGINDLSSADAIFLTSAGIGVRQVTEFAGRTFGRSDHPITSLLPF